MPSVVDKDITQAVRDTVTVESRNRINRSQTQSSPVSKPTPSPPKRSQSQDSSADKKPKSRAKKSSQHADVIDRLDFTGVGPMFHHDGPFDACAPSRNRHKTKAPMMAWTPRLDDQSTNSGPYPSPNTYNGFSDSYEPPKKKVDAIAEAWGIHEPEPFEEFFAGGGTRGDTPASSIYNGKDSHSSSRKHKESRKEEEPRSRGVRRSVVPPPQPIFIHDQGDTVEMATTPPATATGIPKRSKSIMKRILMMRDAPNVPVPADFDDPPSPPLQPTARPTHRSHNSSSGNFNGKSEQSEPFVYIDAHTNKDLPATPGAQSTPGEASGYFDGSNGPASPGLGRKTSIMKKVGRVVRGTR